MSTISIVNDPPNENLIYQGDIFRDLKYNYISSEDNDYTYIKEYGFPYSIIISQSCDVTAMAQLQETKQGKLTKFVPSILLCPIYNKELLSTGEHIEDVFTAMEILNSSELGEKIMQKDDCKVTERDFHYRFHNLTLKKGDNTLMDNLVIDFKHYYTLPMECLLTQKENRIFHLDSIYAEQITLKFATYLSRVAIPTVPQSNC